MNDQIVELSEPGLQVLFYSPGVMRALREGGDYARCFPDGRDLVDYVNDGRVGALGVRWPGRHYWLHFSSTMDAGVVARASDHVHLGLVVSDSLLCVRGSDDLFSWRPQCPEEQLVSVPDDVYAVTACMVAEPSDGPVRIYLHFAPAPARPELGYQRVPELYAESPVM